MESDHWHFTSIESDIKFTIYNTSPPSVIWQSTMIQTVLFVKSLSF